MAACWCLSATSVVPAFLSISGSSSRNLMCHVRRGKREVVCMAPDEEKMTRRSPLDFPIMVSVPLRIASSSPEWERPKPGRRPDIFPKFSPMKTPLPTPLPSDPPEEDEEEEEKKEDEEEEEQENEEEETEKPKGV